VGKTFRSSKNYMDMENAGKSKHVRSILKKHDEQKQNKNLRFIDTDDMDEYDDEYEIKDQEVEQDSK